MISASSDIILGYFKFAVYFTSLLLHLPVPIALLAFARHANEFGL